MKVCIIGRTNWLLEAARRVADSGHTVNVIITAKASAESQAQAEDFEIFAKQTGAQFFRSIDSTRHDILNCLREKPCDIALTMNFPGIIRKEFISLFSYGVYNCHGSLLPRNRGNACPNWSILNGDDSTGLTIHRIDTEDLDTGPIAYQEAFKLTDKTYIGDVYNWYNEAIPDAFIVLIKNIENNFLSLQSQDERLATYCYPRRPSDSHVDFRNPTSGILRLIRGSGRPFEGAYAFLEGTTMVRLFAAEGVDDDGRIFAVPGQVLNFVPGALLSIKTLDGILNVTDFSSDDDLSFINRRSRFAL
jgi:methionyl-tRNA formyltransferase